MITVQEAAILMVAALVIIGAALLTLAGFLGLSIVRGVRRERRAAAREAVTADTADLWRKSHERYWRVNPDAFTVEWAANPDDPAQSWEFKMPTFDVRLHATNDALLSKLMEADRTRKGMHLDFDHELFCAQQRYDRRMGDQAAAYGPEWLERLFRSMSSDPVQRKIAYAQEQGHISETQADGLRELRINGDVDFEYLLTPPEGWQPKESADDRPAV